MTFISIAIVFLLALSSGNSHQEYGSIDFRVIDSQGKPIAQAIAYAQGELRRGGPGGETDKDGKFTLKNLPEGEYFVDAYKESEGYPRHFGRIYDTDKPVWRILKVTAGKTEQVTLQLGPKCARLRLTVEDEDGRPTGATVNLIRLDGPRFGSMGVGHDLSGYREYLIPPDAPIQIEVGISADHEQKNQQRATWKSEPLKLRSDDVLKWKVKLGKIRSSMVQEK